MLIEKWCQSEQSSHLDTEHTHAENFVKRYKNSQGCVIKSVLLKCPRSQARDGVEAVKLFLQERISERMSDEFYAPLPQSGTCLNSSKTRYQKHYENDEDEWERCGFFKKLKRVSRNMMIKAKNIIMKERIWITVKLTLGGLIPAYCAGPLDTSQMTGESLLVTTRKGDQAPT